MENITHALLGATLTEVALPHDATRAQRRVFFTVGVVASNLPDADLVYTSISAAPIGYLLHHRGHTHTLVGLAAQAVVVGAVCMLPAIAQRVGPLRHRLWSLIAVALLGHLVLDSWNSYGVHPFWPFDNRWFYGDAIFIVEPWFWIFLGTALWLNRRRRKRGSVSEFSAQRRSGIALGAMALFVLMMFGFKSLAHARALDADQPSSGQVVDLVLSPKPANPFCWTVLSIVKNEPGNKYIVTRGTASVAPRMLNRNGCGGNSGVDVQWDVPVRQSLSQLRAAARDDCWIRAWLQFGRAPVIASGEIADMRYGGTSRANFTSMRIPKSGSACPVNLTSWTMPRADLLD